MTCTSARRPEVSWPVFVGILALFLLIDVAVTFGVFGSSVGSIGFMDDSSDDGIILVPLLLGAVAGALQTVAFRAGAALLAAVALLVVGVVSFWHFFDAGLVAVGCILGAAFVAPLMAAVPRPWLAHVTNSTDRSEVRR